MKKYFIVVVSLILPLGAQVFEPTQDSYVYQYSPNSNYGAERQLKIYSNIFDENTITRSLIEFDLTSIPPGTGIQSALLNIYMFNQAGSDFAIEARGVLNPWNEMNVTWNNQPAHDTDLAAILPYQGYGWWHFDITALAQFWVDNPGLNHGLKLKMEMEQYPDSLGRAAYFYSRDTSLNQPNLEVMQTGVAERTTSDVQELLLKPNPARSSALLCMNVTRDMHIQITMYDISGREMKEIFNGDMDEGSRVLSIDTNVLAAGTYFIEVNTENSHDVKQLVILK